MNNQEKRKIIQKALFFLHSSPNNNRKRKRKPLLSGNRFIFSFKNYKAIVFSKDRVHKKRQYKKYYLLSFFPD